MSTDTDLKPAIARVVAEMRSSGGPGRVEVAGWKEGRAPRRPLLIPRFNLWCHWLDKSCYDAGPRPDQVPVAPLAPTAERLATTR